MVPTTTDAMTLSDFAQYKGTPFPSDYPVGTVVRLFSPQDKVHDAVLALLSSATTSIVVSMYGEDDPAFTAAIVAKAKDPSIFVQVNLDKTQSAGKGEIPLVEQLRACPATRVAVGTAESGAINHLKMAVVDGLFTLGGSTNWSAGGEAKQNNEASITMDRAVAHEATIILTLEHQEMLAQEAKAQAPVG